MHSNIWRMTREQIKAPGYGRLSGFWGNLPGRVGMLLEVGGDVSITCLSGPCVGCHVAPQPRQRSLGPGDQTGVTAPNGRGDGTRCR